MKRNTMKAILKIPGKAKIFTSDDDLIIQDSDLWIGEQGSLPGSSFPEMREVSFKIIDGKPYLSWIIHAKAEMYIEYKNKEVLISSGILTDVSISEDGTISARISARASRQILSPDPERLIDYEAFPREGLSLSGSPLLLSIGDGALGKFAPIVFGRPGATTREIIKGYTYEDAIPGSPAYLVESTGDVFEEDQTFLIAGHPVSSSEVIIFNANKTGDSDTERLFADKLVGTVFTGIDNRGYTFSYAKVARPGAILPLSDYMSKGDTFFVKWIDSSGSPVDGGLQSPYGEGVLTGCGDVIRYCADVSGLPWRKDKRSILSAYNNIQIDTYINQPTELWTWALTNIISFIPAISVASAQGIYLAPFPRASLREDCKLIIGEEASYGEIIFTKGEDLPSSIVLSYAPAEHIADGFAKQIVLDDLISDKLKWNLANIGTNKLYFEASAIYEDSSAAYITTWLTEYYGSTWAYTSLEILYPDREVEVGDQVWLEAWGVPGIISSWKTFSDGSMSLEIIFKPAIR
jgi:hypothetical protein